MLPTAALAADPTPDIPYGSNASAGQSYAVNGTDIYVEAYGSGPPLLLLHGNGQSIKAMHHQIDFFAADYRVIAIDSRGHGKSGLDTERLTYEQMADDTNAVLGKLKLKSVNVLGWSDGGIVGLLLAHKYPDKVGKLAIMGANLNPEGAYSWAQDAVARHGREVDGKIAAGDKSKPWKEMRQKLDLLGKQPNIPVDALKAIQAPTLVMAGDKDVIRDDHTLLIFHSLPHAHLCIFPGATHLIPHEDPLLFNQTVQTFFAKPYARPDTKTYFSK